MNIPQSGSRIGPAAARLLLLATVAAAPLHGQQRTLPFDPLTPGERATAEQLARGDSSVLRLLEGKAADIASIELFVPKPPDDGKPLSAHANSMGRRADLVFSVLDGPHFGVWVRVDMQAGRILEVQRVGGDAERGSFQVPFAPREVERAGSLVLASAEGRRRLGDPPQGWVLEYRPIGPGAPGEPCFRSRCVAVLFRRDRTYLRSYAFVNLETGTVIFQDGAQ
ncbi:MAG TPA: hypothetical protein VE871_14660 [Longimicrobium sp.]|nr:hypothetical protein [Longimicrobium sp.]